MSSYESHGELSSRRVLPKANARVQRTREPFFIPLDPSPRGHHDPFGNGCLQVGRLIVSAPGELRLGANFGVLATPCSPSSLVCER